MSLLDSFYVVGSQGENSCQINPCKLYEDTTNDRYANPYYMGCYKYADVGSYQCGAALWYSPYWLIANTGDTLTGGRPTPTYTEYVTLNDTPRTFEECSGRAALAIRPLTITCDWYDADGNFLFSNPAQDTGLTPPDLDVSSVIEGTVYNQTFGVSMFNISGKLNGKLLGIPTGGIYDMSEFLGDIALGVQTDGYLAEADAGQLVPKYPTPTGYDAPYGSVDSDVVFSENKNGTYPGFNVVVSIARSPSYNKLDGDILLGAGDMGRILSVTGSVAAVTTDTLNIALTKQSPMFPSFDAYDNTTLYSGFMYRFLKEV